ncbi:hypothetical protein ABID08_002056 [Rhizobium binae]|uniref:Uncharacterized protein n=1 Tax=Rhizobium binae TaxID=1138190 RepID=A0ABV2MEY6_9HYPH
MRGSIKLSHRECLLRLISFYRSRIMQYRFTTWEG